MKSGPPYWADRFLRWYCHPRFLEEIEGDIYELFDRRAEKQGLKNARLRFIWDVFRFFRWSNIRKSNSKFLHMNRALLFRNYLKLGIRNIRKNIVSSSINIAGLSMAICFAISIFIFADMQLNMDRFHTQGDRIYQLVNYVEREGDNSRWGDSPLLLGPQIAEDHPSIESYARVEYRSASVRFETDVFDEFVTFVDPAYMEMFDFPILTGNKKILYDKNKIVISRDMAVKYFSEKDPIGETLSFKFSNGEIRLMTVGAVLDKLPYNSSIREDFLVPIDNFLDIDYQEKRDWSFYTDATFIMLKEGETIESATGSFDKYVELQHGSNPEWRIARFDPVPLYDLSTQGWDISGSVSGGGHPAGRYALITIALVLLGMACFNFMNISVVSATKRLKEIALRKVMGGVRKQIINQFLVENVLQCFFALILGTLLAYFVMIPWFDVLIPQMELEFRSNDPVTLIVFLVSLLLGVGLISGAYPAFYISKFDAIAIFKGTQKFGAKNFFSKIMLGVQLFFAVFTIVGCFVVTDNSIYLGQKDWGYDPEGSLSVFVTGNEQYEILRNKVLSHPDVISHTASDVLIGRSVPSRSLEHDGKQIPVRTIGVFGGYPETFRLRLKAGRFITDRVSDQQGAVVINEKFAETMDWEDPINKTFTLDSTRRTVVGVVEDFHYYDFFNGIDPVMIHGLDERAVRYLSVRTEPENLADLDAFTKEAWHEIAPNDPYDRVFQEDAFDGFYAENKSNISILLLITGIAIVLACLGLYGLLSFNIQGKLKEFSVRKVLGATPKTLARIAGKQYSWILVVSFILGAPLGFLGMQQLVISVFPDNKGFSAMPFVVSIILIVATLTITVAGQVRKAIRVNPADVLRNE